jgi:hypothetical protein
VRAVADAVRSADSIRAMPLVKLAKMNPPRPTLRIVAAAMLLAAAGCAVAQTHAPAPPPPPMPEQLEPLPEIAPPPPGVAGDPELEPQVTVTKKEGETVEEARVNGKLLWIKVTPRHGKSYYLIPDPLEGMLVRRDGFDPGLRVPLWVLFTF